ncbi:MAG: phosphoenolpyruvate carboxykinase (GTP) [Candidatus Omnitrophica bacterium]|nr:phosphoenolpyruvate carboxykinase (GTP) [Candidatus Omnitrophota bacterium]
MANAVEKWVEEVAKLTEPRDIYWCNGSEKEARLLIERGIKEEKINGKPVFYELNQKSWPNAYLHRSHPSDVARTENLTFVCHSSKELTGPNNNWMAPDEAKEAMKKITRGCMRGRTMYVLPFVMGNPDSPFAKFCVQVTDVSYVAVSMRIMTRMSSDVLKRIDNSDNFIKGLHSIGDLSPERRLIMHFPEESLVWSIGSGYGGNALLGKKCISLRLASYLGFREGWLAEHMIIIGVEDPKGNVDYLVAALPSACGKTNLSMLRSALPGYKIWTLGDDIAWIRVGDDGRLWASNPEAGFFGVAPGTSYNTNPCMIDTLKAGTFYPTLFTNTALNTDTNEPWWESLTKDYPANLLDWQGNKFDRASGQKCAHPNSRFTVSINQCTTLSKDFDNPQGVPISGIILGGRRSNLLPLVYESFDWDHGVFSGAMMGSETTAAAQGKVGVLRRDPMAMLPFCGYNMGDYFGHWLKMGKILKNPPKIFFVNWFRKDDAGKFLWPGFGENIRVLKWIIERTKNKALAKETHIGLVPDLKSFDREGLSVSDSNMKKVFSIDEDKWDTELKEAEEFFEKFGNHMPKELHEEFDILEKKLKG